jgi:hypothetical protein
MDASQGRVAFDKADHLKSRNRRTATPIPARSGAQDRESLLPFLVGDTFKGLPENRASSNRHRVAQAMLRRACRVSQEFATARKRQEIARLLEAYRGAVNFYVRSLWQAPGALDKRTLARLPAERTRLQSMHKDQALRQALSIVSSTRRSAKAATTVREGGFDDYPGFVLALGWKPDCGDQPARGLAPEAAAIPSARWQGHGMLMATIQFSNLRVRPVTPKARFAPILPITEIGCNTVVRLDPPMRAFAPTPGPREISPLTPT